MTFKPWGIQVARARAVARKVAASRPRKLADRGDQACPAGRRYRRGSPPSRAARSTFSSLAKRACDLFLQRLEQVLQRAALVGLDEDLDRHAGKEMNIPQAGDLLSRQHDADRVIGLRRLRGVLLLLPREIGRHA